MAGSIKERRNCLNRDGYFGVYVVSYLFFFYMNIRIEYLGYLLMR